MSISITSPVVGAAQTGLTSPSYTVVPDTAPDTNGKQVAVTVIGGTQTGVLPHTLSQPFTGTFVRPKNLRGLPAINPVTGTLRNVPKNTSKCITRKGVIPLAGQSPAMMTITTIIDVPAGADTADASSVRAALAFHIGLLTQQSSGFGDTLISAVI